MSTPFFDAQRHSMMELLGRSIGCAAADFEADRLTIVDRPADIPWYSLLAVKFGVGVVVSVEPGLREAVERLAPARAARALRPELMQRIVDECSNPDRRLFYQTPSICWALRQAPDQATVPDGFTLRREETEWMLEEEKTGVWENGIGQFAQDARNVRNRYAFVLSSTSGDPVAIAGVFETYGMLEIGVDVLPAYQGRGLAPVVVTAAARQILADGRVPLYGCAADNIRSQRTALASGFLPVYADAAVSVATV